MVTAMAAGALLGPILSTSWSTAATTMRAASRPNTHKAPATFPAGIRDLREPSGEAPPGPRALRGYVLTYQQDFNGRILPSGWGKFTGVPSGNPGSAWAGSHVLMGGGMVRAVAYRDPRHGNRWITGGLCQCGPGQGHRYGAYFIRSRVTGPGPDENELLWPVAHVWPPEIDLNEMGGPATSTSWTVHYGSGYRQVQGTRSFRMTRWHTWGVIWTPRLLTFTIDGHVWGRVTNVHEIPHQAMTLDIQQETYCGGGTVYACPTHIVALQVDWVAEYRLR
jgi:hypothetical protein